MKNVILVLIAALTIVAFQSCSDSNAAKPGTETVQPEDLNDLGFSSVPSVKEKTLSDISAEYKKKTGLDFISDDSLIVFCRVNTLVQANASEFKSEIPEKNKREILNSYSRLNTVVHYYHDDFFRQYVQVGQNRHGEEDPFNRKGVIMVAPFEMFNENAFIKRDPMAIVKVDAGWLVLSKW